MKGFIFRTSFLVCFLLLSGSYGNVHADMLWTSKCSSFGVIKQNQNPPPQQLNCLLTNAALNANIPPEIVKAVASKESGWRQFDENGQPLLSLSQDGGIGIMQITNQPNYDQEKLKDDIAYNIEAGVDILKNMYDRTDLPKIRNAGPGIIENWYFPVMAYNGTKPANSPLYQSDGRRNLSAYQEVVFKLLEQDSFLNDTQLAPFPFQSTDFTYNPNSEENIIFNKRDYVMNVSVHATAYLFQKGNSVFVSNGNVNLRSNPSSSSASLKLLKKNDTLIIDGDFKFDQSLDSKNQFVWYPVKTVDQKLKGYISSAYLYQNPIIDAPTNISANSSSYKSIKLGWTLVSGASGYEIYRSTSMTGVFSKVATTSSNSFTDASLVTGTNYYYKIRSYKNGIISTYNPFSKVVSVKPIPSNPVSVKATTMSNNRIKTSWSPVNGASGYQVYRATASNGTFSLVGTTTSTNIINTGLTAKRSYYYKIRAYRNVGSTKVFSNFSSIVSAKGS